MPIVYGTMQHEQHRETLIHILLDFAQRNAAWVIAATVAITLVMGYFAVRVRLNPDIESLVPEDDEVTKLIAKYASGEGTTDYLYLLAESENVFTLEKLRVFETALNSIQELPGIEGGITPFNFFTFRKAGVRLDVQPLSIGERAPQTKKELETFKQRILGESFARNFVLSTDADALAAIFPVGVIEDTGTFVDRLDEIIAELDDHFTVYTTGSMLFTERSQVYLMRDFSWLSGLAVLFILVMFYVGFRSKRAVVLPILTVSMGTVWCLGFMSLVGYELSLVAIMTPPLVITLGSSYSIHILNQYYRESHDGTGRRDQRWITLAVEHVTRTILLTSLTTVIGFLSLITTTMPQTKEFGISTSVGVAACSILTMFFFPAYLSLLKHPEIFQYKYVESGFLTRRIRAIAGIVLNLRWPIFLFLLTIPVLFYFGYTRMKLQSDYIAYFPSNDQAVQDLNQINLKMGGYQQMNLSLNAPNGERNYFLETDVLKLITELEERMMADPNISTVTSFPAYLRHLAGVMTGKPGIPETKGLTLLLSRFFMSLGDQDTATFYSVFANEDFSTITIVFTIFDSVNRAVLHEENLRALIDRVESDADEILADAPGGRITYDVWGIPMRYLSLSEVLTQDQRTSTIVSVIAIWIVASLAFKSIRFGLYALIPLLTGIMLNIAFMAVTGIALDLSTIMVSSVAIGVGVDDSLHFIIQFRKQRIDHPEDEPKVISRTLELTGRPIFLTTVAIVGGLLVLAFANFQPIRNFGILVSFALTATMFGTIFILPVILYFDWKVHAFVDRVLGQ